MINDYLKNICLIIFALIGPITLPAGGIQSKLNDYKCLNNSKEIILSSNYSLYVVPNIKSKKLTVLDSGNTVTILRKWSEIERERDIWFRVELLTNQLIDNPNKITRGWIKI